MLPVPVALKSSTAERSPLSISKRVLDSSIIVGSNNLNSARLSGARARASRSGAYPGPKARLIWTTCGRIRVSKGRKTSSQELRAHRGRQAGSPALTYNGRTFRLRVPKSAMTQYLAGRNFDKRAFAFVSGDKSVRSVLIRAMGAMF